MGLAPYDPDWVRTSDPHPVNSILVLKIASFMFKNPIESELCIFAIHMILLGFILVGAKWGQSHLSFEFMQSQRIKKFIKGIIN